MQCGSQLRTEDREDAFVNPVWFCLLPKHDELQYVKMLT